MTVKLIAHMFNRTITTEHPSMDEADQRIVRIAVAQGCRTETNADGSGSWIANDGPLADEVMGTWTVELLVKNQMTPRRMIKLNAPGAVGIVNVVLWVRLTDHSNEYIADPSPLGLLKIHEIDLDGQISKASFSVNGTSPFVQIAGSGVRPGFVVVGRS